MGSKLGFQNRIIRPVFIILSITILTITAGAVLYEKKRFQKQELKRIYHETVAIKKRLGILIFGSSIQTIKQNLESIKLINPGIIYYTLVDMNGRIMVCDDPAMEGKTHLDSVEVLNINQPLFEASQTDVSQNDPAHFRIYLARLTRQLAGDGGEDIRGRQDDVVFDTFWDVLYRDEKLGVLRVGFSREGLERHLVRMIGGMLFISFFILMITLGLIIYVVKRNLKPLEQFTLTLSDLNRVQGAGVLRERLAMIHMNEIDSDSIEIHRLKQAFSKIRDVFILNWDQLEQHRQNLEMMVDDRTRELNRLNLKLSRQIEKQKAIETRLINSQKLEAIGTLAGGIAHEFNNLFMAITGYASLIQKQSDPGHRNTQWAEKIRNLVDNGSHSIKQLLGFARIGKYQTGIINVNDVLQTNIDIFARTRKDLAIKTRFAEDLWTVWADRSQIEQIIMNLLLNASEAMPGNGKIWVETHKAVLEKKTIGANKIVSGRFVHFSIQDGGRGIRPEDIPRIYDPFFTTKPLNEGSGLGLASVYGVVDNHGGFTTVESIEGKGSVFNVFLPAADEEKG